MIMGHSVRCTVTGFELIRTFQAAIRASRESSRAGDSIHETAQSHDNEIRQLPSPGMNFAAISKMHELPGRTLISPSPLTPPRSLLGRPQPLYLCCQRSSSTERAFESPALLVDWAISLPRLPNENIQLRRDSHQYSCKSPTCLRLGNAISHSRPALQRFDIAS